MAGQRVGWARSRNGLPLLPLLSLLACTAPNADSLKQREVREASLVFEANLAAIRDRDVEAYLATYLDSPDFVYLGPEGVTRGFAPFAAARRALPGFPDTLVAGAPELTWVAPGVVHVAYPYAAVRGNVSGAGWSERVLVRTRLGWKVAVTAVIPADGRATTAESGQ
jgi:hypothetical protein